LRCQLHLSPDAAGAQHRAIGKRRVTHDFTGVVGKPAPDFSFARRGAGRVGGVNPVEARLRIFILSFQRSQVDLKEQMAIVRGPLQIQFHGSYKPTGEQRTFPNLFNREGVLNLEYSKFNELCTPQHDVYVAYTRLLAGPMDYHLGGFRATTRKEFKPRDELPFVLGTRCHQLSMYVVYENPMPMVCDVPRAYEGQPGFDFIVDVPTTWDETRFVAGEAGEYVVVARRSGDTWYLGGMTNWTSRTLKLPLKFLGSGQLAAKLYLDRSLDGENPNELRIETRDVSAADALNVSLASGGGMVAIFRPKAAMVRRAL